MVFNHSSLVLRLLPLLLGLSLFASCNGAQINLDPVRGRPLVLASDPPGARVLIDSKDSGWVTPCALDLDEGNSYLVEFSYPGYESALRLLDDSAQSWAILWREMYTNEGVWHFPLWLGFEDFILPVKFVRGQSPSRIFVRLKRSADQ